MLSGGLFILEKSATLPACSGKGVIKGAKIVIRITIETIIKPYFRSRGTDM